MPVWINARTDVFLAGVGSVEKRLDDALERATAYAAAGANSLFVSGLINLDTIAELAGGPLPIAVMVSAGAPTVPELASAGAVRISLGPAIAQGADHPKVVVSVLGGRLAKGSHALVGAATVQALRSVRADVLVLGVCSVHPVVGITVFELEESYVKQAMIANAAEVVAVSSAEKLRSAGPYVVAPLDELTHLVTDESARADQLDRFRAAGVEVVLV